MCNLSGTAVIIAVSKSFLWDGFLYIAKKIRTVFSVAVIACRQQVQKERSRTFVQQTHEQRRSPANGFFHSSSNETKTRFSYLSSRRNIT